MSEIHYNMTLKSIYRHELVGTKGVSQVYHLSFDDNKVLKIINWILLKVYSSVHDHEQRIIYMRF